MLVPNTRAEKDAEQCSQAKFLSVTDKETMELTVHCWVVQCGGEVEQLNPPNVMDEEVILTEPARVRGAPLRTRMTKSYPRSSRRFLIPSRGV